MEAALFVVFAVFAALSCEKEVVIATKTRHIDPALSMNIQRLLNLVTSNAIMVPLINPQQ